MPRCVLAIVAYFLVRATAAAGSELVLVSPGAPIVGGSLRIVAVADRPLDAALTLVAPDGAELHGTRERHGGSPYWWYLEETIAVPGAYRACLEGEGRTCTDVAVTAGSAHSARAGVWPVTRDWNRGMEDIYSAWVEKLFDDPLDAEPSWHSLDEVTREAGR